MTLADFLARLQRVKKSGDGYLAACAAHDDRKQSLSIKQGDRKILVYCHAGCTPKGVGPGKVLLALGLTDQDLYTEPRTPRGLAAKTVVATYAYRDEGGTLLYEVRRYVPKGFLPFLPGATKPRLPKEVRRVLYRLPELIADATPIP